MAIVRLENVTKKYGDVTAISQVSFQTVEGEFFFLLGPSGAGKTTIFNLIAGILPVTHGNIYIDNQNVNKLKPRERNVAIAFESYALYPNRTVYNNIRFPLDAPVRKNQMSEQEKHKVVEDMAKLLQINELLERYPKELSGGQKQRVALGRTLVRRPNVYLLDEPIAHLDAKLRHQMRRELKRLQKELNIPVIFATPDQSEAVAMADRIAILNYGKIQQIGTPNELYFYPINEFVASTLGEPKMSFVDGDLHSEDSDLFLNTDTVKIKIPQEVANRIRGKDVQGAIRIGIRYSDIKHSYSEVRDGDYLEFTVDFNQIHGEKLIISAVYEEIKLNIVHKYDREKIVKRGSKIWLKWDSKHPYVFDRKTGNNLLSQ